MLFFLLPAIALTAVLHMLADARKSYGMVYVFKPLTVVLIIVLAMTRERPDRVYHWAVLGGLVLSLAGDVFLMLRHRRFTAGLVCFLAAHLFYIVACLRPVKVLLLAPAAAAGVYGMIMERVLEPGLGRMKAPVLVYLAVLLLMLLASLNRWMDIPSLHTGATLAGATLFVLSDSMLAIRQFRRDFPGAQALILATYYVAQTCIALG